MSTINGISHANGNHHSIPDISITTDPDSSVDSTSNQALPSRPTLTSTPSNRVTASTGQSIQLGRKSKRRTVGGAGFGRWYDIMRFIGRSCDAGFFRETKVIGEVGSVPSKGPVIV